MKAVTTESLDQFTVADLTAITINGMSCEELTQVIRTARLPTTQQPGKPRQLRYYDRDTLRRLAHQAKHACRNLGYGSVAG